MENKNGSVLIQLLAVTLTILALAWLFHALLTRAAEYPVQPVLQRVALSTPPIDTPSLPQNAPPSPEQVKSYVSAQAREKGINPAILLFILEHESQNGVRMRGDDGNSRGYFQISSIYHPEVTTACADNLACSTAWTISRILDGHISEWSTWAGRCKMYPYDHPPNCPH